MFGDLNVLGAVNVIFTALGWMLLGALLISRWDSKKGLRSTLESLRDCLCQAKGLLDAQPENKPAHATYDRASKIHVLIENGLETHRDPNDILRAIVSEVGVEMAISARFQAGARK